MNSDPRAFLSAQEKRAEQLKALGIQENDIGTDVIEKKKGAPGRRLFHFTNPFEMCKCLSIKNNASNME